MHVDGLNLEDQGLIQLFCGIDKGKSAFIVFCLAFFHNYCWLEPLEEYKGINPPQSLFSCLIKVIFYKFSWRTTRVYTLQGPLGLFCKSQELKGLTPLGICESSILIHFSRSNIFSRLCQENYKGVHPLGVSQIDLTTLCNYKGIHPQVLSQAIYFIDPINPKVRH